VNTLGEALARDLDAAFPKLVEATQDRVYSLALSLTGKRADAEDIAQDAFVRAYRALQKYPPRRIRDLKVRAWLAKIALNVWRNRVRTARHDAGSLLEEPPGDARDAPAARTERSEEAMELRVLLANLPARYRSAVVMRHAYGLPYAEAAAALGIPEGTLKANVHRGTRMLRELYAQGTKVEQE
jgi:RNA polymerase sigma factor (sigma-70 family)